MNSRPAGLGDSPSNDYVIVKEELPLPKSRKEIVDAVAGALAKGGVQRLTISLREPIRITRLVPRNDADVPEEVPADELLLAARHADLSELPYVPMGTAHADIFRAFVWLQNRRLTARAFVVHSFDEMRKWLDVGEMVDVSKVFGVDVYEDVECPADSALFLGIFPHAPERIEAGLRISMYYPKKG